MSFLKIDKTIYFEYKYNEIFSNEIIMILNECNKVYFNNNDDISTCFKIKDMNEYFYSTKWKISIFNQPIDNLPNTITHLILGTNFDKPIDNLPNTIIHLTLDHSFNQAIDNLPNTITHLRLGTLFNQPIDNLPNSITHLTLSSFYNNKINYFSDTLIINKM